MVEPAIRDAAGEELVVAAEQPALEVRVTGQHLGPRIKERLAAQRLAELRAAIREEHPRLRRMDREDDRDDIGSGAREERGQRRLERLRGAAELQVHVASIGG